MSETMTTGEIEDVLSSIRRLVSEDLRPAPTRPAQATLVSEDMSDRAGKLILTPALRIVPASPPEGQPDRAAEPLLLVRPVADTAPKAPQVMDAPDPDTAPHNITPRPEVGQDPWAHDDTQADDVQAWPGEAGPQSSPDPARAPVSFEGWPPIEGTDGWPEELTAGPDAETTSPRHGNVVGTIGASLQGDVGFEPETGDTAPVTRLSWIEVADRAEEEPEISPPPRFVHRGDARTDTAARSAEPDPALIGTTEDVLDEAVLREIVRAVLREELQGHLGERITRNIRKLVRAEINRSLTLRDYD